MLTVGTKVKVIRPVVDSDLHPGMIGVIEEVYDCVYCVKFCPDDNCPACVTVPHNAVEVFP